MLPVGGGSLGTAYPHGHFAGLIATPSAPAGDQSRAFPTTRHQQTGKVWLGKVWLRVAARTPRCPGPQGVDVARRRGRDEAAQGDLARTLLVTCAMRQPEPRHHTEEDPVHAHGQEPG